MQNLSQLAEYFPLSIADAVRRLDDGSNAVREIRLHVGSPPIAVTNAVHILSEELTAAEAVRRTAERMCQNSLYARQNELRSGYVTLPGGHRAGFCGRTVLAENQVAHLTDISSVNLRIAHQIIGAADNIIPHIVRDGAILNTLVISPPACGKTTLLRDIARQLAGAALGFRIGIVDERGELAAMYKGEPQNDVGILSDVYDGCPKPIGMRMLLRGMSPQAIITDEMGGAEDEAAAADVIHAGVRLICSIHGYSRDDVIARGAFGQLVQQGVFRRVIVLSNARGIGTVERIY